MSNNDKFISLDSLKEYNKQMRETYIKPLEAANKKQQKELNGKVVVATFNITEENTAITLQSLEGMTEIDWGDGTINNELTHTYINAGEYRCKIYDIISIRYRAFHSCTSLTSIVIPNSVTSIGEGAFQVCSSLAEIVIPNSVTEMSSNTFWGCSSLTNAVIGSGVTQMGAHAFCNCSSLTSVTFKNPIPITYTSTIYPWFENCSSLTHIYVPYGCKQAYVNKWAPSGATQDILDKIIEFDEEVIMSKTSLLDRINLDGDFISFDNSNNNFIKQVQTASYYIEDRSNAKNRVGLHIQPTKLIKTVNDTISNVLQLPTNNGTLATEETVNNKIKALNINFVGGFISFDNDKNFIKQVQKESYYIEDRPNKYGLHIQPTRFIRTFNGNPYCTISLPTTDGKLATEEFVNNNINLKTNPNIDNIISHPVTKTVSHDGYDYNCSGYYLIYEDNMASGAATIEIHAVITCSEDTPMSIAPSNKSTLIGSLTKYILPFFPVTALITDAEIRAQCVSNAAFAQLIHYNLFTERNITNNSVGWLNGNGVSQPQLGHTTDAIYVRDFIVELDDYNKNNNLVVNGFEMIVKIIVQNNK